MLKLREKDHNSLIEIANKCFKTPIQIWAYGSRVNGDSHDASDLDLVVRSKKKLEWDELLSFQEGIQESNIPILVQVMDWNKIPESFHQNIIKNYVVLYSNEQSKPN